MKKFLSIIVAIYALMPFTPGNSQSFLKEVDKQPLDTNAFNNWLTIYGRPGISDNGRYIYYYTRINTSLKPSLIIQGIDGNWKKEYYNASRPVFTRDNKKVIFIKGGDTLCFLRLGSEEISKLSEVVSFKYLNEGSDDLLLYKTKEEEGQLVIKNLRTNVQREFGGIKSYLADERQQSLFLTTEANLSKNGECSLLRLDCLSEREELIWRGQELTSLQTNADGKWLAFLGREKQDSASSIFVCNYQTHQLEKLPVTNVKLLTLGLQIKRIDRFSKDGRYLFVSYSKQGGIKPPGKKVGVDIWSYSDAVIQSQQLDHVRTQPEYMAILRIDQPKIQLLQLPGEQSVISTSQFSDDYILKNTTEGEDDELYWSKASLPTYYIFSTDLDTILSFHLKLPELSPDNKFILGYTPEDLNLYCYELKTGKQWNISKIIPVPSYPNPSTLVQTKGIEFAGWLDSASDKLLVYDRYDIWKVDLLGKIPPVNLTSYYGRQNNVKFQRVNEFDALGNRNMVTRNGKILLHTFNYATKDEGFAFLTIGKVNKLDIGSTGAYDYSQRISYITPLKALHSDVYVVERSNVRESPNYFVTRDFKTYNPVTNIHPESKYNWLTSTLVSFKALNGEHYCGILYKPNNFDTLKSYPVIIHYYEQRSDELNKYRYPYDEDNLSIAWFVSHGYLVFVPDIFYKIKENGNSVCNSVLGAVNYLDSLSWINRRAIALEGHSFGGYETNYLITHSNCFAAAISSSGMVDDISDYGDTWGVSKEGYYENRQGRMATTLWGCPECYIRNSPIFHLNNITAPVLMVANHNDNNVHFQQGLEMYLGLRRLGKKVWMLQYDGEDHGMTGYSFVDFTLRSQQFLDYYLRSALPPKWMAEGVPASNKGSDGGLELEKSRTLKANLLIDKEQEKVDSLQLFRVGTAGLN